MKHTQHLLLVAAFVLFALPSWVSLAQAESVTVPTAVTTINTAQIYAQVAGMPKLSIVYDQAGKESSLKADFDLSVTAGPTEVLLNRNMAMVSFMSTATSPLGQKTVSAPGSITSLDGGSQSITDSNGGEFYVIPVGQTRTFTVTANAYPKFMFPGSYRAKIISIGVSSRNTQQTTSSVQNSSASVIAIGTFITLPANQTNEKVIIGETSPYITAANYITSSGSNKMSIVGERFLDATDFAAVFIDGTKITGVDGTKDGKTLFFVRPLLAPGNHNVYVKTSQGASNAVAFMVSDTPVTPIPTPVGVTVSVERKPRLELVFGNDRQNGENNSYGSQRNIQGMDFQNRNPHDSEEGALLKATFEISVNGGKNGVTLHNWSDIQFLDKNNQPVYGRQTVYPIVPSNSREVSSVKSSTGETLYVIPAGRTVRFTQYSTVDPRTLFAGTYYATTRSLFGTSNSSGTDKIQFVFEKNETNMRTIIGEISPFIISATPNTPRLGETVVIKGKRLGGSTLKIGDVSVRVKITGSGEAATFVVPSTMSVGQKPLIFTNKETGSSNWFHIELLPAPSTTGTTTPVTSTSTQTSNVLDGIPVRGIWW